MTIFDLVRRRREFDLPTFELVPLEIDPQAEEHFLDAIVTEVEAEPRVAAIDRTVATAGELHARIENHLHGSPANPPAVDAADELRNALAELRQSLR